MAILHYTLIFAISSYLLGSIPFGYLLVRIFRGQDVRQTGSGNIGATNVARTGSKGLAIVTLVLDALKGYGHMFPVWLRFKGGKGVATAVGSFLAIAPTAVGVVLVVFIAIVALTRYVSLGSMVSAVLFPFAAWWLNPETNSALVFALMAACAVLIVARHKDNIRRLLDGNENKLGGRKAGEA